MGQSPKAAERAVAVAAAAADPARRPRSSFGPLAGVRVADFCWMGVGACATRILGDFGAEVIRIEDRNRLDMPRVLPIYKGAGARNYGEGDPDPDPNAGGLFNNYNRNKLGVTINMRDPRGRALCERLIASSSVVTENFAPGVMERWGLTYDYIRTLTPNPIMARMSGFGHSGPHADFKSYGPVVQAVSGLSFISGLPGREPSGWGLSYMDNMAAFYNGAALLMAIYHRNQTGEGTEIDVSAIEAGINLLGPILLDVTVNGRRTKDDPNYPLGNRVEYPNAAPHGVYPVRGEDRWIAISVFDEAGWAALVAELGNPDWAGEARFATQARRFEHQDALDALVGEATATRERYDLMHRLQARGVAAAVVQTPEDVNEHDPQLAQSGVFFDLDHPVIGRARFEGTPIRFSKTTQDYWRSAPLLGEDNHYVFTELLGLSEDEYQTYAAEGVI
ncbi:CaiB/BaiF CoA transferase family protein [Flavisphingomonas formosensis]|uniref:CaiB/BaiF CoA transferase family protein n=1 Tax=Flavisphingomonas formosensis TaxID=861534 RepID=UPI0012FCA2EE|nr:CoA transferase [Sphingomonas formosensis]